MKKNRIKYKKKDRLRTVVIVVNIIAILFLIYFGLCYISYIESINNPKANILFPKWEGGALVLLIGLIPMIITNLLAFKYVYLDNNRLRYLFFIPSIITILIVGRFLFKTFTYNNSLDKSNLVRTIRCKKDDGYLDYQIFRDNNGTYALGRDTLDKEIIEIDYTSEDSIINSIINYYKKKDSHCIN